MDIARLQYFERVARVRSFTRAAQELHVAQPALSKQVALLERELGAKVFERRGHDISLTQVGQLLLRHVDQVLRAFSVMESDVEDFVRARPVQVVIGASPTASRCLLPAVISRFALEYPHIALVIATKPSDRLLQDVADGRLDLAIGAVAAVAAEVKFQRVLDEDFALVISPSHPWADRSKVRFRELRNVDLVVPPMGLWYRDVVAPACARHGFSLKTRVELGDYETMRRLIRDGVGVGLMPRLGADESLVAVRVVEPELCRAVGWMHLASRPPFGPMAAFQELLQAHVAEHLQQMAIPRRAAEAAGAKQRARRAS
jgi:LysR family transcriptional regulator, transcription activator of glutamate synthase operon